MDSEADCLAYHLIQVFAAALRDLNEGKALPAKWREQLDREVGPRKKRGRPSIETVTHRDLAIARRMLEHKLAFEAGKTTKRITNFAQELAAEYAVKGRAFEAKDIFQIYKRYHIEAMSDEICRRLRADDEAEAKARADRAERITKRLQAGEQLNEILADPSISVDDFKAIRNHQTRGIDLAGLPVEPSGTDYPTRRKAILQWLNDGMKRGIHYDPVPVANLNAAAERKLIPKV